MNKNPTIKEVFEFCDKVDSVGDIHIGLFEATEIFNCWLDIKKIYDKNYLYTPPKTNEKVS